MMNHNLQEQTSSAIVLPMAPKRLTTDPKKRYRLPLEIPEETRPLWRKARVAALNQDTTIGAFIMEAVKEKLDRLDAATHSKK